MEQVMTKEKPQTPPSQLDEAKRIMAESYKRYQEKQQEKFERARQFAKKTWGENFDVYGVFGHLEASGAREYILYREEIQPDNFRHFIARVEEDGKITTRDIDIINPPLNTRVIPLDQYLGKTL